MGGSRLAVIDGTQLSISEFDAAPGSTSLSPVRGMFFQSAAYAVPEEPLSGLAYDSAYDWFYAVKASAPRSVFLLRWDGTGKPYSCIDSPGRLFWASQNTFAPCRLTRTALRR